MEHQRPDSIPGYSHPQSSNTFTGGVYKTFSEKKPRGSKEESFGSTNISSRYASHQGNNNTEDNCPICSDVAHKVCNCIYNDKTCSNGHTWYTARDGQVKQGNPHHTVK